MTGRDLIIYILENHLEDDPVFKDGIFVGFTTPELAAAKCGVGVETVRLWFHLGYIDGVKCDYELYIFKNEKLRSRYRKE
jgi:hypothetical protein